MWKGSEVSISWADGDDGELQTWHGWGAGETGHERRLRGAASVASGDVISCAHREASGGRAHRGGREDGATVRAAQTHRRQRRSRCLEGRQRGGHRHWRNRAGEPSRGERDARRAGESLRTRDTWTQEEQTWTTDTGHPALSSTTFTGGERLLFLLFTVTV